MHLFIYSNLIPHCYFGNYISCFEYVIHAHIWIETSYQKLWAMRLLANLDALSTSTGILYRYSCNITYKFATTAIKCNRRKQSYPSKEDCIIYFTEIISDLIYMIIVTEIYATCKTSVTSPMNNPYSRNMRGWSWVLFNITAFITFFYTICEGVDISNEHLYD